MQYPTAGPSAGTTIGPYFFDAASDAAPAVGRVLLCVISHGGGGSHLLYRSIGTPLAASGYVVVSPEHPGARAVSRHHDQRSNVALHQTRRF